jgi:hypothetical protein
MSISNYSISARLFLIDPNSQKHSIFEDLNFFIRILINVCILDTIGAYILLKNKAYLYTIFKR